MKCANPNCHSTFLYARGGSLRLLPLEDSGEAGNHTEGTAVAGTAGARYFWLCRDCSRILVLKQWTARGLLLESRHALPNGKTGRWMVKASPAVETTPSFTRYSYPRPA